MAATFPSRTSILVLVGSALLLTADPAASYSTKAPTRNGGASRRAFVSTLVSSAPVAVAILAGNPSSAFAAPAATKDALLSDLKTSRSKLEPIPQMLIEGQWDPVRTILKTPPVNQLWNLGESQNTLVKLAKETGEFDLIELKDELAISLQMCDQYTYDNAFVYFQPGNGKTKLKEPTEMAQRAMKQIQDAIDLVQ